MTQARALLETLSKPRPREEVFIQLDACLSGGEHGAGAYLTLHRRQHPRPDKCRIVDRRLEPEHVALSGKSLGDFCVRTHGPPSRGVPDKVGRKVYGFDHEGIAFPATDRTAAQDMQAFVLIL